MKSRIVVIFLSFVAIWVLLLARGVSLQVLPDERLSDLKQRQYETTVKINGRRGAIYDADHRELAVTVSSYSLFADPAIIENPKWLARKLYKKLNMDLSEVNQRLRAKPKRFVWLKRHLTEEQHQWVRQLDERGLGLIEEPKRVYPGGRLFAQVLGSVGQDGVGLEGLELQFENELRGEARQMLLPRDARGRPLLEEPRLLTNLSDGKDLHLTLDSELQFNLESELEAAIRKHGATAAVGVILDPTNSAILAMASIPNFDLNDTAAITGSIRRNRVVSDMFEPGSTLKTFVIATALKEGLVKPRTRFNCEGGKLKIGGRYIKEADANHNYDWLTVSEILAYSSNVGMAKIAFQLGDERVQKGLAEFGFHVRTGIELPGEAHGLLNALPWRPHLLSNISFGHGIAVTPLQVATAYAAIANGGVWRQPHLVQGFNSDFSRQVLSATDAATMVHMLTAATGPNSTGIQARINGFPVAGKTGTAQKVDLVRGGYLANEYISSFAGFVPAHSPKYVIYVAVDSPKKEYYGSQVAAPLFARLAQFAMRKSGLAPVLISEKDVMPVSSPQQLRLQKQALTDLRKSETVDRQVVPNLLGLSLREALSRTKTMGIHVDIVGSGLVQQSLPEPGEQLPETRRLRLVLEQ